MNDCAESLPEALRVPPPRPRTSIDALVRAAATLDRIGFVAFAGFYLAIMFASAFAVGWDPAALARMVGGMSLWVVPLLTLGWWATESPTRAARALAERGIVEFAAIEGVAVARNWRLPASSAQRLFLVLDDGRRVAVKNGALGSPPGGGRVAVLVDGERVGIVLNGAVFPGAFVRAR